MRIGVNALFFIPGEVGGSETYLCETLKALPALGGGHEMVLFTNRENDETLFRMLGKQAGVFFQSLEFSAANRYARILREQIQLPLAARRWNLNVLWSPGYTAPLLTPCPQVVSILDMQYKTHPRDLTFLARFTTHLLIQMGARKARRVIAISEFSKAEIVRHTRLSAYQIDVTPLAANPAFCRLRPENDAGIPGPYLLCVANTYPHKNVHALAEAYAALQNHIPHHLVLVGKPRLGEPRAAAAIKKIADSTRLHRLEGVSQERLIALYQRASLFVFPSFYEGFGLPVLEAMLAGTPVLAARCGAIPEVGGDTIDYFDPRKPGDLTARIAALLTHPENKTARARARALTFTWTQTAELTLATFRRVAKRPGPLPPFSTVPPPRRPPGPPAQACSASLLSATEKWKSMSITKLNKMTITVAP